MKNIAILTVDDEKIILDSIRSQLERNFGQNYFLEFAETAEEALDIVDDLIKTDISILLVISDYQMPGMKGDEFVEILKGKLKFTNIVMLTGQMPYSTSQDLLSKQIILKVIQKPWQEQELISMIKSISAS